MISGIGEAGSVELGAGDTAWSNIALTDFTDVMGNLPDQYWREGQLSWLMRRDFYASVVQKLMYAAGGNTTEHIQAGTGPTLMGYPIVFSARMPDSGAGNTACFFGNFSAGVMLGMRNDVSIARSSEFAFDEDVVTVRLTHRYDIEFHEAGDGSNAGAVVSMELAAA